MDEEDGPFGSLIKTCQTTSSQENVLQTCPFARESDVFPDDDSPSSQPFGIPVESTGIVMVSPPESSRDNSTSLEDFQTPPENSLPASSEEQRPQHDAVDEGCTESERTVDLGKDSSENLVISGVKSTQVVDGAVATEVLETELEEFVVLPRDSNLVCDDIPFEPVSKKLKFSDEILGGFEISRARTDDNEPVIIELNRNENTNTEVLDLESEEIDEDTMYVDLPLKETEVGVALSEGNEMQKNSNRGTARKNIEDLDKFKYVNPSGRRELPLSIIGQEKNAGGEVGSGSLAAENQILKGLLDALKLVAGELDDGSEENVDFLETAKKRGMTFPRPRWWPEEGYDD